MASNRNLRRTIGLGVAGAAALTGLLATSVSAQAAMTPFAAQARSAGLSTSQATAMQREVNQYVARTGGTQVSANRIDFAGGYVLVAAPSQKYAADLAAPTSVHPNSYSNCGSGDFCAYSGSGGTGSQLSYYKCQDVVPFTSGNGSVYNHQTGGAQTKLYRYRTGGTTYLALTLNAGSTASWTWTNTADVRTC